MSVFNLETVPAAQAPEKEITTVIAGKKRPCTISPLIGEARLRWRGMIVFDQTGSGEEISVAVTRLLIVNGVKGMTGNEYDNQLVKKASFMELVELSTAIAQYTNEFDDAVGKEIELAKSEMRDLQNPTSPVPAPGSGV